MISATLSKSIFCVLIVLLCFPAIAADNGKLKIICKPEIQIYLDDQIYIFLKTQSKLSKKTMSEIIRESIKNKIDTQNFDILKKLESIFGIWKDKKINVEKYIRNIRKDRKINIWYNIN